MTDKVDNGPVEIATHLHGKDALAYFSDYLGPVVHGRGVRNITVTMTCADERIARHVSKGLSEMPGIEVQVEWADLVGFQELADMAEVKLTTAWEWRKRGVLPKPDVTRQPGNHHEWRRERIERWLRDTGRWKGEDRRKTA